jgi:hypothetical protein
LIDIRYSNPSSALRSNIQRVAQGVAEDHKGQDERINTTHTLLAIFEKYLQEMAQKSGYVQKTRPGR